MLDDLRNHDAHPSDEEQKWIGLDDLGAIARAVLLASVALALGWGVSTMLEGPTREMPIAYGTR